MSSGLREANWSFVAIAGSPTHTESKNRQRPAQFGVHLKPSSPPQHLRTSFPHRCRCRILPCPMYVYTSLFSRVSTTSHRSLVLPRKIVLKGSRMPCFINRIACYTQLGSWVEDFSDPGGRTRSLEGVLCHGGNTRGSMG